MINYIRLVLSQVELILTNKAIGHRQLLEILILIYKWHIVSSDGILN